MHGLSRGSFEQVVDDRNDEQLLFVFFEIQKTLVGVDNLFQVGHLVGKECKVMVVVIGVVQVFQQLNLDGTVEVERSENTPGEVPSDRNEIDGSRETVLQFGEALPYFGQMLMGERFVDGNIVVAPTEMGGGRRFLPRAGRSGNGVNVYLAVEQQVFCQGEQGQLNGCGETAGIGHPFGANDIFPVQLGQTVYEVVPGRIEPIIGR